MTLYSEGKQITRNPETMDEWHDSLYDAAQEIVKHDIEDLIYNTMQGLGYNELLEIFSSPSTEGFLKAGKILESAVFRKGDEYILFDSVEFRSALVYNGKEISEVVLDLEVFQEELKSGLITEITE